MWANLLLSLTAPIVVRVLSTLGLGVVTYTGFTSVLSMVYGRIATSFSGLPVDISQLIFLSGLPSGISIVLSALAARLALVQLKKIQAL